MRLARILASAILLILSLPSHSAQQWQTISQGIKHRSEATLVEHNNQVYLFNGFTFGIKIQNSIEKYDVQSNTWTLLSQTSTTSDKPTAVTHNGAVLNGNDVWLIGGRIGNHPGKVSNQVWIYNIPGDSWRKGPSLPIPFGGGGAALVDGKIHVIGGFDAQAKCDVNTHFVYDLAQPSLGWQNYTSRSPMPVARNHFGTVSLNGKIYTIGGQHGHDACPKSPTVNHNVAAVHAYNPITDSWQRLADLPGIQSHTEPSTFAHNGKIYMVGGAITGNKVLSYNPANNQWTELTQLKLPLTLIAAGARIFNNQLYVFGGGAPDVRHPVLDTRVIALEETNDEVTTHLYRQLNGHVVIEAEKYTANTNGSSHQWQNLQSDAMVSLPDSQTLFTSNNLNHSPMLSYRVNFSTAGTHDIWVRGLGDSVNGEGKNDSLHIGLNGKVQSGSDKMDGFTPSWSWRNSTRDKDNATLVVPSAGMHYVNILMREDGLAIDKIIITNDNQYQPSGSGPAPTYETSGGDTGVSNLAPVVNAGKDISIALKDSATLQGAVSDDGLPNNQLSHSWAKTGGPGRVTFIDPKSLSSNVSFSVAGIYQLTLTADDGELTAKSKIQIIVTEENVSDPLPAKLQLSKLDFDFGSVKTGNVSTQKIRLKNTGGKVLRINQILLQGSDSADFLTTIESGLQLDVNEEVEREIQFQPKTSGEKNSVLTMSHDPDSSLALLSLTGLATAATNPVGPGDREIIHRINIGGPAVFGADGVLWSADLNSSPAGYITSPSNTYATNQLINIDPNRVPTYAPASIFQTERWSWDTNQGLTWAFPVEHGDYEIRLYFAEIYSGTFAVGARAFDIIVEGRLLENDYDIFADVGGNTGVMLSYAVSSDQTLQIKLQHAVENPAIKAIEILKCNLGCAEPVTGNQAPLVNVGIDQSIMLSDTLSLNASASDDGKPIAQLSYQWSAVSGPGSVTFSEKSNKDTTVTFSAIGNYVLKLTVSDSALNSSETLAVQVKNNAQPPPDSSTFREVNGQVSIEAEHFLSKTSTSSHNWVSSTSSQASNGAFMTTTPDNGVLNFSSNTGPMLSYRVFFDTPGKRIVWVRGFGDTNPNGEGKSDSLHIGLNGKISNTADKIDNFPADWAWSNHTRDSAAAVLDIPTAGLHMVNIFMREDGLKVDKIILAPVIGNAPVGIGPAETR